MPANSLVLRGSIPNLSPENARRLAVYLVRGNDVLAYAPLHHEGHFRVTLARHAVTAKSAFNLELVVGPAGGGQHLEHFPHKPRVTLSREQLERAEHEYEVPLREVRLSDDVLRIWWRWCRWYCLNGSVVGPDGCPVPFAQVTVYSVANASGGFSKTPRATVTADVN